MVVVIGLPSAPFEGLQIVCLSLWDSVLVSFDTIRTLPTDSAVSISSSTLCMYCLVVAAGCGNCSGQFSALEFVQLVEVSVTLFKQ